MIVVMRDNCSQDEIDGVVRRIAELGLKEHVSTGTERTIIGILGQVSPDLQYTLPLLSGVEEVIPISKPYKLASREFHPQNTIIKLNDIAIGSNEVVIIAGPCAVESEEQLLGIAREIKTNGANILRGGAFKPRTSPYSFRGLGEQGLKLLAKARQETGLPIITEVMTPADVELVASYAQARLVIYHSRMAISR